MSSEVTLRMYKIGDLCRLEIELAVYACVCQVDVLEGEFGAHDIVSIHEENKICELEMKRIKFFSDRNEKKGSYLS